MYQPNIAPRDRRSSAPKHLRTNSKLVGSNKTQQQSQVRQLPQQNSAPVWLKLLLTAQQGAMVVFCGVFGLSAISYGYTVYTQNLWKSQHGQLRRLQMQERQQGVMNENLKQRMAQTADQPTSGLVAPSPAGIVFITTAPPRPIRALATPPQNSTTASKRPLGY
jgi:hypothetical protein